MTYCLKHSDIAFGEKKMVWLIQMRFPLIAQFTDPRGQKCQVNIHGEAM